MVSRFKLVARINATDSGCRCQKSSLHTSEHVAEGREFRFRTEFDSPKTPQLFVVESGSIQLVVLRNRRIKTNKGKVSPESTTVEQQKQQQQGAIGKSSVTHSSSSYPSYEPASSIHR